MKTVLSDITTHTDNTLFCKHKIKILFYDFQSSFTMTTRYFCFSFEANKSLNDEVKALLTIKCGGNKDANLSKCPSIVFPLRSLSFFSPIIRASKQLHKINVSVRRPSVLPSFAQSVCRSASHSLHMNNIESFHRLLCRFLCHTFPAQPHAGDTSRPTKHVPLQRRRFFDGLFSIIRMKLVDLYRV